MQEDCKVALKRMYAVGMIENLYDKEMCVAYLPHAIVWYLPHIKSSVYPHILS